MRRLVLAWVVVNAVLMAPQWLSAAVTGTWPAPWLSLEATAVVGAMALLPRAGWSRVAAWAVATCIVAIAVVAFADLVFRVSLGRSLNLSLDLYLLDAVYRLAVGNSGRLRTVVGAGAIGLAATGAVFATSWLLSPVRAQGQRNPNVRVAAGMVGAALLLGLGGLAAEPLRQRFVTPALALLADQAALSGVTRAERRAFESELEVRVESPGDASTLLSRLEDRNVVLAYIESYGMAALEDPEFAAVVSPRLRASEEQIRDAGLHVVSGSLTSPTLGGQSWYAHGTMISGLWLDNQLRYELLLASDRETLVDDFRRAGYRTATLMPAITTAWPEAIRMGYDDVYTAQNIPYAGPPFYWVTMPDQYTWSFLGSVLHAAERPLFVEAGMVSSHAPWTPILPLVEWEAVGDGAVFEPYRRDGYPPEELWWDVGTLRAGYADAVGYSLQAMSEFAEQLLDGRTLLIVSGDHQAAPWVTGTEEPRVPVHVIARDPALLGPFASWGFRPGAFPDPDGPAPRMDEFREWFLQAFSEEG